ncbi:UNVERIFIED_CONTAM: APO protein 2, chloroplastic [Sesamum calycinum]|uniref:APO protein 2, chloroplastic n=1 Tax=Sesamum calycinum TaxID=2727403 RepID=A0AAW2JCS0_9LAMI
MKRDFPSQEFQQLLSSAFRQELTCLNILPKEGENRSYEYWEKEFIDADQSELPDPDPDAQKPEILAEILDSEIVPPSCKEDMALLAEEMLEVWEEMREGAKRLTKMYPVRVCGYCPEVHVAPTGHKAQNCGAHKHQQRNGQHGWQAAVLDDLIPPKFVWHVTDVNKPLERELRNFYGQAPAVVELCTGWCCCA